MCITYMRIVYTRITHTRITHTTHASNTRMPCSYTTHTVSRKRNPRGTTDQYNYFTSLYYYYSYRDESLPQAIASHSHDTLFTHACALARHVSRGREAGQVVALVC